MKFATRVGLALAALALAACDRPENARIQVLIGAALDGVSGPSVVIVEDGKFRAAGPQTHVPIPPDSVKVDTSGYRLRGPSIVPGAEATFELVDGNGRVARRMQAGQWQ
ncbi:MAG: hypothetical protein SFV18_05975 [Bryobacteraceae bacterium]|nr:hypothetical protein [Bryobacteraceae bacterium]